jgi:iron complex transport system permease protein
MRRSIRWVISLATLLVLLLSVCIFSLCIGTTPIPIGEILHISIHGENTPEYTILFRIRLPRIILGCVIGGALSLVGVILQCMFQNPLVEPYTLGISGGASLGVCLNLLLGLSRIHLLSLPISGFIGAVAVILFLYILAERRGFAGIHTLLLTGVMISFIASSGVMLVLSLADVEELHGIVFWIMGSLEEPHLLLIKIGVVTSFAGLLLSYLFSIDLNALSCGEEEAMHLGIDVRKTRRLLFVLASALTGCSVAICGVIGFVGLVIPHLMRMIVGYDHRILLVASYLGGGAFLVLCDTMARMVIAPVELPVGVITGICGGGIFVYALHRRRCY